MITRQALFAAVLAQALAGRPAWAQDLPGEPDRGRALAKRWCVECHEVAPGKRKPWAVRVSPSGQGFAPPA